MEKLTKKRIFGYAGFALALSGLFLPVFRVPGIPRRESFGLLPDLPFLGTLSGWIYILAFFGLVVTGYCGYISIAAPANMKKAAIAAGGFFLMLLLTYVYFRTALGGSGFVAGGNYSRFFRSGIGIYAFLTSGICYLIGDRIPPVPGKN